MRFKKYAFAVTATVTRSQQSVLSVSTDLSTIQKSTVSLVNRPVKHALLTIQKMPVFVDAGMDTRILDTARKAKTRLNGRAGAVAFCRVLLRCAT